MGSVKIGLSDQQGAVMTDEELRQLVESNARAIQALSDNIAELTHDVQLFTQENRQAQQNAQEERSELRRAMMGLANLMSALDVQIKRRLAQGG